ncbi:MAG: hypothetical protein NXI27_12785 [Alphaproteobacteria bacterium]|nr:hypothetical protein [Alphaproteobacteria bacterium]
MALVLAGPAAAHVSQQGFVLLLPTNVYMTAGIWVVAVTALAIAFTPGDVGERLFSTLALPKIPAPHWETVTSLLAFLFLCWLVSMGLSGSRDPLANPLPLFIWTVFWIMLVIVQAVIGNLWHWINPWTGIARLLFANPRRRPILAWPAWLGSWPAIVGLLAFSSFVLADPAPDDPARLAMIVAGYWLFTMVAILVFGERQWLARGEFLTILMRHFASLAPLRLGRRASCLGAPAWQLLSAAPHSASAGIFVLILLGTGSFDGLNETFWWLSLIDVNPLEFPGRSAIITETVTGLLLTNTLLVLAFAILVWTGHRMATRRVLPAERTGYRDVFGKLCLSTLPIALAYHVAHYLTVVLVNGQYALAAASDPYAIGADYLGLGTFYVTTGFFNSRDTVQVIFLTQAGAVVLGHAIAILIAHAIALRIYGQNRLAVISQIPVAAFMIAYTFLGLWLLAAPKGA